MSGHTPWRCKHRGHEWFPPVEQREFVPYTSSCLHPRCRAKHTELPWGTCIRQHPIAEHYDDKGDLVPVDGCPGPA